MSLKKKLLVILGGNNEESNLSIHSARFVYEVTDKYDITFIILRNGKYYVLPEKYIYCNTIEDFIDNITEEVQLEKIECDLVIPIIHGIEGEGGKIQTYLDTIKKTYMFSSGKNIANMFFKEKSMSILKAAGFNENFLSYYETFPEINKPIIIKPSNKGSSTGVKYLSNSSKLKSPLKQYIIQEHINGQEFSSVIINGKFHGSISLEYKSKFLSYRQKYFPDEGVIIKPLVNKSIIKDTERIFQLFNGKDIIRIDGFIKPDGSIIYTDINPIPSIDFNSFTWICCKDYSGNIFNKLIDNYICKEKTVKCLPVTKVDLPIIFGGDSPEKNISLLSVLNVFVKLQKSSTYNPIPFLLKGDSLFLVPINSILLHNITNLQYYIKEKPYCTIYHIPFKSVFLALHGGMGENGTLQKILHKQSIQHNGESSELCKLFMNKIDTINKIKQLNLPNIHIQAQYLTYNGKHCIMKPIDSGSSIDVFSITREQQIKKFQKPNVNYFFEDFIDNALEMTVTVFKGKVLVPSLCVKKNILSCEDKFLNGFGTNITPALSNKYKLKHIKETLQRLVERLHIKEYCRIDFFYFEDSGKVMIIEINSLPSLSMATVLFHQLSYENIKPLDFLENIIEK